MQRTLPPETGLKLGQRFVGDGGVAVRIVGHLPHKPAYSICVVAAWKLEDPNFAITPGCLISYRTDFAVRRAFGKHGVAQCAVLREARVAKLKEAYGIWPEAISTGFFITIRGKTRHVRVVDLSVTSESCPITVVELDDSDDPGREWCLSKQHFGEVPRHVSQKRPRDEGFGHPVELVRERPEKRPKE